jgi:hypothetical protein
MPLFVILASKIIPDLNFKKAYPVRVPQVILFNNQSDIQMFIHDLEEQFWIFWTYFPFEVVSAKLPFQSVENTGLVQVTLEEKITTKIDQENSRCSVYNQNDFIECYKKELWTMLKPKMNCSFAGKVEAA